MAVVGSLLAGIGVALLAALARPTVDSTAALRALTNRPLLGTVSSYATPVAASRQRMRAWMFVFCALLLIGLQMSWLAWLSKSSLT